MQKVYLALENGDFNVVDYVEGAIAFEIIDGDSEYILVSKDKLTDRQYDAFVEFSNKLRNIKQHEI